MKSKGKWTACRHSCPHLSEELDAHLAAVSFGDDFEACAFESLPIVLWRFGERGRLRRCPRYWILDLLLPDTHDIVDREQTSWPENAINLATEPLLFRNVHSDVQQSCAFKAAVREGKFKDTADAELGPFAEANKLRKPRCDRNVFRRQV